MSLDQSIVFYTSNCPEGGEPPNYSLASWECPKGGYPRNTIIAGPYIQKISSDAVTIRIEGKFKQQPFLTLYNRYGVSMHRFNLLKYQSIADSKVGLFEAEIKNLKENTNYYYKVRHKFRGSKNYSFRTLYKNEHSFAFISMSDAQRGKEITTLAIRNSVMKYAIENYHEEDSYPLSFMLFTGDLVQNGNHYQGWNEEFFYPLEPILSKIAVYPAIGNHEYNSQSYYNYFGDNKNLNHPWYLFDYQNTRFITLNSDHAKDEETQLSWLEKALSEFEVKPSLDFLIVQAHHPAESELAVEETTTFSKKAFNILKDYSVRTNKHIIFLTGHVHGYSRGHEQHSNLTTINNAAIGANLVKWGRFKNKDMANILISKSEFGWGIFQIEVGKNPALHFKRYSFGNSAEPKDQGVVDMISLNKNNSPPISPTLTRSFLQNGDEIIKGSPFEDTTNDKHLSTEWEIGIGQDMR